MNLNSLNLQKLAGGNWSAEDVARKLSENLLDSLGLEQRRSFGRSTASVTGLLGAGMLIGAGLALWLAPRNGVEARGQIGRVDRDGAQPLTQM